MDYWREKVLVVTLLLLFSAVAFAQTVFINEFHYDNTGADENEFVEIAGPVGTDLTDWDLEFYNGSNGQRVSPILNLSGTIADDSNGFGFIAFLRSGIQNDTEAIALVDPDGTVVQFISYEGTVTATNGSANGMTSVDIGVSESSSTPVGRSLQLGGFGTRYEHFYWQEESDETPDLINNNQTFGAETTSPTAITDLHNASSVKVTVSDAQSGIGVIKVEAITGGMVTVDIDGTVLSAIDDEFTPPNPITPVQLTFEGASGDKVRLRITDKQGNSIIQFLDIF